MVVVSGATVVVVGLAVVVVDAATVVVVVDDVDVVVVSSVVSGASVVGGGGSVGAGSAVVLGDTVGSSLHAPSTSRHPTVIAPRSRSRICDRLRGDPRFRPSSKPTPDGAPTFRLTPAQVSD